MAKIAAGGLATITGYGTTTITATVNGVSASTSLTAAAPTLNSITLTPQNPTIFNGKAVQFTATGNFADRSTSDITNQVTLELLGDDHRDDK